ncbi:MAG: hypothetical protein LBG80_03510 [Bacteroidales bacterium]|jgi:hypothetical protein|nr:hypothetical protein [Bacteroidales bacterium]
MKKIPDLKLTQLGKVGLDARKKNLLRGRGSCPTDCGTCGCLYEGEPGGSSTADNQAANKDGSLYSPCVDDYDPYC